MKTPGGSRKKGTGGYEPRHYNEGNLRAPVPGKEMVMRRQDSTSR